MADADYDCRPPCVRPTVSEPKANSFFAARPSYILLRTPQAWRLQPSDDAVLAFTVRAFSRMATVQPDRIGAGSRTSEKSSAANLHVVSICTAARELTWSNWIIWLTPEPFPKAIMGDERIRTLGDAWQHAIGNVTAGPAWCLTG
ncbi:MAG TPA: hypothetical protein VFB88_13765 [Xanthobacteraceae bacterium]|nr:hypothetical protein [Xanthobacteraceae bacterium]